MRQNDVRSAMKKGLISLLTKKDYLNITVTDLVNESGVARASFYRLYSSIDSVMDDLFDEVKERIAIQIVPAFLSGSDESVIEVLEQFFKGTKAGSIPLGKVLPENRNYIILKFEKKMSFFKRKDKGDITDKYRPAVNIGIIVTIAMVWAYNNFIETPREIAEYTFTLLQKQ